MGRSRLMSKSNEIRTREFKDGVSDGLLVGTKDDTKRSPDYKQGYDFGVALYCQLKYQEDEGAN